MGERRCLKALSSPISCSCVRDKARLHMTNVARFREHSMRARKTLLRSCSLLYLRSASLPRKGERPSLNLCDDPTFWPKFWCAPLSSFIASAGGPVRLGHTVPVSQVADQPAEVLVCAQRHRVPGDISPHEVTIPDALLVRTFIEGGVLRSAVSGCRADHLQAYLLWIL
jgi:hypothetical protein